MIPMDWTEALLAFTALVAAPLLALTALVCLTSCRGRARRWLGWAATVFVAAVVVLSGGNSLLERFGLTWRNGVARSLCLVILASGLAGAALTLLCLLPRQMPDLAPVLRWMVKGGAVVCAGLAAFYGLTFGLIFTGLAYGAPERVVEYQGQTLVEEKDSWLDTTYNYYEYHGPLVRGGEILDSSMEMPLGQGG